MKKIGIYDSGCGGLSVLNNLLKITTENTIYYYADSLNNPWGNKTKSQLLSILKIIAMWFKDMNIDIVICGCNTTYSLFKDELSAIFGCPVLNLISEPENYSHSSYSILATENTIESNIFKQTILSVNQNCQIQEIACPGLAHAIETNQSKEMLKLFDQYIQQTIHHTIILGCTHYPLVIDTLQLVYPQKLFIDPSTLFIKNLNFPNIVSENPTIIFNISGDKTKFIDRIDKYLSTSHYTIYDCPKKTTLA